MNKRQSIPFVLLLAAFLLWLYFKPETVLPELPEHHPSYIANNVNSTHFDETGLISHKIFADKATSFTEKNITVFEKPKVIVYIHNEETDNTTVWQVTSEDAVLHEQNRLELTNNVWLKNLSLDQLVQSMATEKLTVLLDENEVSSDLFVTWLGPQMKQQGVGMWASLVTEELIVKDQIKTVYLNEKK
ncbi:LPS export ABC transporter periplasmic protein LptC [Psychromonas aquimarina]|uniref:LPS export ABC transporter periplasmic protein LptC n=1 Tax=Psychromonas aquimarina TaxID=444919 RepID=UPI0003F531C3|nr:LPS export ABC transporter periplasmic protein LptC [Psychromonas aquimarina]